VFAVGVRTQCWRKWREMLEKTLNEVQEYRKKNQERMNQLANHVEKATVMVEGR